MASSIARPLVLLADDELLVRDLVQDGLEEAGYEVVAASTGAEALEALAAQRDFVAIVTDINFGAPPDGWAVAMHAREARPQVAVVYMTGDSAHEWSAHGVPQSVIITKPFSPFQVAVAVGTLLNRSDPTT